jgi:dienelactone hydrolase
MKIISLLWLMLITTLFSQPQNQGPYQAGSTSITLNRDGRNLNSIVYYPSFIEGNNAQIDTLNSPYPIIAFGHGFFMQNSYYISLFKHLASYGYVVIAPQFPDVNHLQLGFDLIYCANYLKSQNQNINSRFYNLIDTTKVGLSGHSMGGGASLLAAANDSSIIVVAPLAAAETNPSAISVMHQIEGIVYLISAQNDGVTPVATNQLPMFNNALTIKGLPIIKGGNHTKFMDNRLFDWSDPNGYLTPVQQLSVTRKYLTSIFNLFLKEDSAYFKYAFGSEAQNDTSIIFQYNLKALTPKFFNIISPADTLTDFEISFIWKSTYSLNLHDTVRYNVIISTDESFNNIIHQSDIISDTAYIAELNRGSYFWKVKASTSDTTFIYSNIGNFVIDIPTGVNNSATHPYHFGLEQNYPNPFNPGTKIKYTIDREQNVSLIIYNPLGKEIALLINENKKPGEYEIEWTTANLSSGIYFYQLKTDTFIQTKKMLLMK